MISKNRKYFSFFGILAATVDKKIGSLYSVMDALTSIDMPKISKLLMAKELKPINLYSTNKKN